MISDILIICALGFIWVFISAEMRLIGFTFEQATAINLSLIVTYEIWKGCCERLRERMSKKKNTED